MKIKVICQKKKKNDLHSLNNSVCGPRFLPVILVCVNQEAEELNNFPLLKETNFSHMSSMKRMQLDDFRKLTYMRWEMRHPKVGMFAEH